MASISGVAHVTLTVRNLRTSESWYCRVLGMERVMADRTPSYEEVLLVRPGSDVVIGLREHRTGFTARFDDTRTGLDHLALTVPDAVALVDWRQRLAELGVECSNLTQHRTGTVITLHDPDHIPLELHCAAPTAVRPEANGADAAPEGSPGSADPVLRTSSTPTASARTPVTRSSGAREPTGSVAHLPSR